MAATARRAAFNIISKCKANGLNEVTKYVSSRSGLTVTIADVEGPLVNGFLCLATETDTDDGLPHTLEHLVFMGSKQYPYKGVLDLLANRCLASGTNAWTAQDHTCYTLTTAGVDGFLKLLPIYINHILQPMLTESQYLTEVHHINGEGEDAGVVYSEMQEHESKMSGITDRAVKEHMYPTPEGIGYRVTAGGRLQNLRSSCSNQKVQKYHQNYYQLANLNIIVSGTINHGDVLETIEPEETRIIQEKSMENGTVNGTNGVEGAKFKKPFRTPIPPLDKVTELTLDCPSDDVTRGMVRIAWRASEAVEIEKLAAVDNLLDYLSDTAVSPLERDFVQIDDPYCSSVSCCVNENLVSYVEIKFQGVPVEKLAQIQKRLRQTLDGLINGTEPFDLERMKELIQQKILRICSSLETHPHDTISDTVIGDFLYGQKIEHFEKRLNDVGILKSLKNVSKEFWLDLLKEYFAGDKYYIAVVGKPSSEYVERASAEEKLRLERQKEKLGESGLKECEEALEKALDENEEIQPPDEIMEKCVVNSLEGIQFVKFRPSSNLDLEKDTNERFPLKEFPFTAMLDDGKTNFADISMHLDTSKLSPLERPLLLLWKSLLFESPVKKGGKILPYEEVVKLLNKDLVSYSAELGLVSGKFMRLASVTICMSDEDYVKGIEWMKDILTGVVFDPERIKVMAQKLTNGVSQKKRDGHGVASFLLDHLTLEQGSNKHLCHIIRLEKFHLDLVKRLETDPDSIVKQLRSLHEKLMKSGSISVHLMCNTEKLSSIAGINDLSAPWKEIFADSMPKVPNSGAEAIRSGKEPLFLDTTVKGKAGIIAIGACEAAHIIVETPSIRSQNDPDLPALMLFLQYLDQCEGPLWKHIRGKGLAYGANVYLMEDAGKLSLQLYRASQPLTAYQETKNVITKFMSGEETFNPFEFEAAKRSLVFEIINSEDTVSSASTQSLLSYFRGVKQGHNLELCKKIWDLSDMNEVVRIGSKYVEPLLDLQTANMAITCHPSKLSEIVTGFDSSGCKLEEISIEDESLCRWNFS